jgi:chromosome partitioning protein
LDPQINLTSWIRGTSEPDATIADALEDPERFASTIAPSSIPGVDLSWGDRRMAVIDIFLRGLTSPVRALQRALRAAPSGYDYILLDSPPQLGLLSLNAIVAGDELIVPVPAESLALEGLGQVATTVQRLIDEELVRPTHRTTIFISMADRQTRLARDVETYLRASEAFPVYSSVIRSTVRMRELFSHRASIFDYEPDGAVAADYRAFAEEVDRGS